MSDDLNPGQPESPAPPPQQPAPPPQQPFPQQGYYQQPMQQPQNDAMQSLIPTSNPPALVSYYCGVFSLVLCFAPILAPISIIYGFKAMNNIKAQPGLKGKGHAITGFILSGITLLACIAITLAIIVAANSSPS